MLLFGGGSKKKISFLVFFAMTFTSLISQGGEILFGPEFTFSNNHIAPPNGERVHFSVVDLLHDPYPQFQANELVVVKTRYHHNYLAHLHRHLIKGQPEGAEFQRSKNRFESPNGWAFELDQDPGVIEIGMDPMSLEDFKTYQPDIQDAIFVSAANVGLFPFDYLGGGHINVSLSSFDNYLHLRNFIVDFLNHAELSMGVFNYDPFNALPFWMNSDDKIARVRQVIARYDALESQSDKINRFVRELGNALASGDVDAFMALTQKKNRLKAHAINVDHGLAGDSKERRIELRAIRPQASMDMFVRQIDLLEKRIHFLSKIKSPLPLDPTVSIFPFDPQGEAKYSPPVDPQEALDSFRTYLEESGAKWEDHRDYLWPAWHANGEIKAFEQQMGVLHPRSTECGESLKPSL